MDKINMAEPIEVKALLPCYYSGNRKIGEVFTMKRGFADFFVKKGIVAATGGQTSFLNPVPSKEARMLKKKSKDRMLRSDTDYQTRTDFGSLSDS